MSGDSERRKNERKAWTGDAEAEARAQRDNTRIGRTTTAFLQDLIGKRIFIEGVRINQRGTLLEVLTHADGEPSGIVGLWQRVSYFDSSGPNSIYTYTHTKPRLIPYEMIHDVGEEGFAEGEWPAVDVRQ